MFERGLLWAGALLACVLFGAAAATDYAIPALAVVVGLAWTAFAAARPVPMTLVAIAVAVFPPAQQSGPFAYGALAATLVGVGLRHPDRLRDRRMVTFLVFAGLLVASHVFNQPTHVVRPDEARHHLIASLLGASIVLTVTLARPSASALLRTLAVAGSAASVYVLTSGEATSSGRFATELLNENATGHIGAVAAVCGIAALATTKHSRWTLVAAPPLMLTLYSQSRGAFVILAIGVALLWALRRSGTARTLLLIAAPALAWAAWPLVRDLLGLFFYRRDLATAESEGRFEVLRLAGRLAVEHPLLGVGWRGFPDQSLHALGYPINAHDEYARVAAESGLVALALLALVLVSALRSPVPVPAKAAMIAAMATFALGNTMSNFAIAVPLWALIGLGLANQHPTAQPRPECEQQPRSRRPMSPLP